MINFNSIQCNLLAYITKDLKFRDQLNFSLVNRKCRAAFKELLKQKLKENFHFFVSNKNESILKTFVLISNFLKLSTPPEKEGKKLSEVAICKTEDNQPLSICMRQIMEKLFNKLSIPTSNYNQAVYKNVLYFLHSCLENLNTTSLDQNLNEAVLSRKRMNNLTHLARHLNHFLPLTEKTLNLIKQAETRVGISDITKLIRPSLPIEKSYQLKVKFTEPSKVNQIKETYLYITIEKETYPYQFINHQNQIYSYKAEVATSNKRHETLADTIFFVFLKTCFSDLKDIQLILQTNCMESMEKAKEISIKESYKIDLFV